MAAQILGISGSPIPNSNTDQAVREVLAHTGLDSEFIKLTDLHVEPCRACLSCANTNQLTRRVAELRHAAALQVPS